MKNLSSYLFSLFLLGNIFIGCSDQQAPTAILDEAPAPHTKVSVVEYSFDFDMDLDDPYENCATGQPMQNHGVIRYHVRETTTPSGNTILSAWVDYSAHGDITLENMGTGEIWTLTNGHNPLGNISKENGFYMAHYHWNELYKGPNNQNLHIHVKGHIKIEPDGAVKTYRRSYNCF